MTLWSRCLWVLVESTWIWLCFRSVNLMYFTNIPKRTSQQWEKEILLYVICVVLLVLMRSTSGCRLFIIQWKATDKAPALCNSAVSLYFCIHRDIMFITYLFQLIFFSWIWWFLMKVDMTKTRRQKKRKQTGEGRSRWPLTETLLGFCFLCIHLFCSFNLNF